VANARKAICPSISVDLVEAVVEKHYASVALTDLERDEIRKALAEDLGERVSTARHEIERCQRVLDEIKEQERKLLNMHYEDRISSELFDDEQVRLRQRRQNVETLIERLGVGYQDVAETLDLALEIISEDLHGLYRRADDTIRRLINQAIFKALYLSDEEITRAELAEPFIQLRTLQNNMRCVVDAATAEKPLSGRRTAKGSRPSRGQEPLDVGSISDVMVELVGLEPTTSTLPASRSPS
jgi:site-specific DNA recombinase